MLKTVSTSTSAVTGALVYQGTWNASTNTPTLASGVGTKGYYYVVSVAGATNLDGITDWQVSDWAVFNGTAWQKVDNSEVVYVSNVATGTGLTGGPITTTGTISIANTAVTAGTYGNASYTSQVTINAQGQITNAQNVAISIASGNVTGLGTMATQNANAVVITGGTINSVTENASTYTNVSISSGNATLTNVNATLTNTANVQLRSLTGYVYANNTANATATLTIPNSGLTNSTTTLGNATLTLGSTTTSVGNLTLTNVTISNVATTFPNSFLANSTTTLGNATLTLGGTTTSVGNLTLANANITSVAATFPNSYLANSSLTIGNTSVSLGGTATSIGNLTLANVTITSGSISNIVVTSNIVTKTSAYTATANDETILGNASTASFAITLPTSVGITGKIYIVKKIDSSANTVTISTTSAQTIDGSASKVISYQYDGYQVQSDGANWFIISSIFGRNGTAGTF